MLVNNTGLSDQLTTKKLEGKDQYCVTKHNV